MTFNKAQGRSLEGFSVSSISLTNKESLMFVALFVSEKIVKKRQKRPSLNKK